MSFFAYRRRVAYYETDAMAIVHHSNYLRFFEEARVRWFRIREMHTVLWEGSQLFFPLVESTVRYKKPARFDDEIEVRLQVRGEGPRYYFQYAIYKTEATEDLRNQKAVIAEKLPLLLATGTTTHALVDGQMRVCRTPPIEFTLAMEKEPWTEIWPLNS